MRQPFVHAAEVRMATGGDARALGGAITVGLCGHWEHEPPCPLAPHHTATERLGSSALGLRTLFAVEPARETEVRERIDAALRAGRLIGPDGGETRWQLVSSGPAAVRPDEIEHATRLASN